MKPFRVLTSHVVLLLREDINTDDIIPAQYLKVTDKQGLAKGLFARWRYREDGTLDPRFPLNQPGARQAQILVTGANFGSGSSREHAVWALQQWGFRAILAPSFADIFYNNAVKNGLLPAQMTQESFSALVKRLQRDAALAITVDLEHQVVRLPDGEQFPFWVDGFAREMLLQGMDELDFLLRYEHVIRRFEEREGK